MARELDTGLKAEALRAKWARQRAEDKLEKLTEVEAIHRQVSVLEKAKAAEAVAVKAWNASKGSNVGSAVKNSTHGTSPAHERVRRTSAARKGPRGVPKPESIRTRTRKLRGEVRDEAAVS